MSDLKQKIWTALRREVEDDAAREPILASFLYAAVLNHKTFEEALSFHLAVKLASPTVHAITLRDVMVDAHSHDHDIAMAGIYDLKAVKDRDPACRGYSQPFLFFKGYQSLQTYRIAHYLWENGRHALALHLQSRMSEVFAVDIHPASRIGRGILMDHATGIVIGETAAVDDDVSLLHEVTLGGTGNQLGDRHPKVKRGVLIGAGAKVLGNLEVGEGAKIGGGSVVLRAVPAHTTVVGVPAKVVGKPLRSEPSKDMNQNFEGEGI